MAVDEPALVPDAAGRWTVERATAWYAEQPWLVGCNYMPSSAINQLEMFQAETFDPEVIDREFGLAAGLGFNSVRVFLHDLLWEQDSRGFLSRCERVLELAEWGRLKAYVQGVVSHFRNDHRVVVWDIWNEPDNFDGGAAKRPGLEPRNKPELVNRLLPQVFAWVREVGPTQPLTSGVWRDSENIRELDDCKRIQLSNSDVISFHTYGDAASLNRCLTNLGRYGRPLLCTEFMARPNGSVFDPHLGLMRDQKCGAWCWGFINGKSQTIYPWDSWTKSYSGPPPVWFHDILQPDGTPFRVSEVEYIRGVTGAVKRK
jgi:hypothetical protein